MGYIEGKTTSLYFYYKTRRLLGLCGWPDHLEGLEISGEYFARMLARDLKGAYQSLFNHEGGFAPNILDAYMLITELAENRIQALIAGGTPPGLACAIFIDPKIMDVIKECRPYYIASKKSD
ncbi:Uncharacterised protein [uncultured archaeon]|nr:Uncharacterised protein [uncultured archaeon]